MKKIFIILAIMVVAVALPYSPMLFELATAQSQPIREIVKEGDVIFQTTQSRQSPLIQIATRSKISHCGVVVMKNGKPYANLGVATASLNYRYVSDEVDLLDILDDIDGALAEIKKKGNEVGVNINRVLLTGDSAGGHLSLLYAYARKNTAPVTPVAVISNSGPTDLYDDNFYQNNALGDEAVISDLMSKCCGQRFTFDTKDNARDALYSVSPIAYVSADSVPTVINHGNADTIVPFSNAQTLDALLTQYGVEHVLNVYNGADHDLGKDDAAKKRADELLFGYIDRFLR